MAISTACSIIVCSACQATRSGSSANADRLASKNTICRTYRPMQASKCSPPRSKLDGSVSRRISNSRRSLASITSKVDPGGGYRPLTLMAFYCDIDSGTSAYVEFGNGTASTTGKCTVGGTLTTPATNNTWTMGQAMYIGIGTQAGNPNIITVSPDIRKDSD